MSTDAVPGGRRRIDRVLAPGYLDGVRDRPLTEVRALRRDAEQEEVDLSYLRRLLHGRMDILRAELSRRGGEAGADQPLSEQLAEVLADPPRPGRASSRFLTVEPSRVAEHRRRVERVVDDIGLSDLEGQPDHQLREALARLNRYAHGVSANRSRVQAVMDALTAEVGRRYQEGSARPEDILPHE